MRAVTLDVFGTLVRLEPPAPRLRAALAARGIEVEEERAAAAMRAEIAYYLAHHTDGAGREGLEDLRDRCADEVRVALALGREAAAAVREAMLESLVFTPFEDAEPALRALRGAGLRLVAASNWDCSLPEALEGAGLLGLLDGVVSSAVAGAAKPDPALFEAALRVAGCDAPAALHVGDSLENDLEGARRAGLGAVLLVRHGEPPRDVHSIRSLAELPSVVSPP